jgi:transcriptional regulator with PAS, ATPase and Fis domain
LKERIEDIDYFIDRFIGEYNEKLDKNVSISDEARKVLTGFEWIGNIRQLKHVINVLVINVEPDKQSKKYVIQPQLVRKYYNKRHHDTIVNVPEDDYTLETAKKKAVLRALGKAEGDIPKAAKLLGISKKTLYNMKEKYGI